MGSDTSWLKPGMLVLIKSGAYEGIIARVNSEIYKGRHSNSYLVKLVLIDVEFKNDVTSVFIKRLCPLDDVGEPNLSFLRRKNGNRN